PLRRLCSSRSKSAQDRRPELWYLRFCVPGAAKCRSDFRKRYWRMGFDGCGNAGRSVPCLSLLVACRKAVSSNETRDFLLGREAYSSHTKTSCTYSSGIDNGLYCSRTSRCSCLC